MGLDMYLLADKKFAEHLRNYEEDNDVISIENENKDRSLICYWRKANQIHGWFVENIQGGVDDQELYPVGIKDLKRLQKEIGYVLDDEDMASEYLPVTPGFFFGSCEYDRYYYSDLNETWLALEMIFEAIKDYDGIPEFWYTCWW